MAVARLQRHQGDTNPDFRGLPNLALLLEAERITGVADGSGVGTWPDASGLGNNGTQGTGANQPLYRINGMNGRPCADFGLKTSNDKLFFALSDVSASTSDYTIIAAIQPSAQGGSSNQDVSYLIDCSAGRLIAAVFSGNGVQNPNCGWYDGSWHDIAATTTVVQVMSWRLKSGTTLAGIYRNGAQLGSLATYTQKALAGTPKLGASYDGTASANGYVNSKIGTVIVCNTALSQEDHLNAVRALCVKYGVAPAA